MNNVMRQLGLRARLALVRGRLANTVAARAPAAFAQSIQAALPALTGPEIDQLYTRHRLSMRKFSLIKDHLSRLDAAGLSQFVEDYVDIEGQQHLDAVKASDAPVIFVTPHYGNFPAGCLKLIKEIGREKTVNAFYNPPSKNQSSSGFEELFKGLGYGFNALFNDDTAVLKALRVLKRGEALTMMPDVFDVSGHVLYVPFFGRLVPAMAGTALFAIKSRATVIVAYNCPGDGVRSTVKLGRPLVFERSGKLDADIAGLTGAIFRDMEEQIRRAPEHWIYLPGIGDLLGRRLAVGAGSADDWFSALESTAPDIDTVLPEWRSAFDEIKTRYASQCQQDARSVQDQQMLEA